MRKAKMAEGAGEQLPAFETHIELASRLGVSPQEVLDYAHTHRFGNHGYIGGVCIFTHPDEDQEDREIFEQLIMIRSRIGRNISLHDM